jgi:hypothetical protein
LLGHELTGLELASIPGLICPPHLLHLSKIACNLSEIACAQEDAWCSNLFRSYQCVQLPDCSLIAHSFLVPAIIPKNSQRCVASRTSSEAIDSKAYSASVVHLVTGDWPTEHQIMGRPYIATSTPDIPQHVSMHDSSVAYKESLMYSKEQSLTA